MADKIFKFLFSKRVEKNSAITIKRNDTVSNLEELEKKESYGFKSIDDEMDFYRLVKLSRSSL